MMSSKLFSFCLVVATTFLMCSCENSMGDINHAVDKGKKLQVEEATDISTFMSQAGNMKAHLIAPLMLNYHSDPPYIDFPKGIHVDFFKDSILIESIVDAKYSRYFTNDQKVLLQDSVVVHNLITGDSLKTNEMWWDQRQQLFYGNKAVKMFIKGVQNLDGTGFTAKQDFSKYTLDSNTTGTMKVPGDMGL